MGKKDAFAGADGRSAMRLTSNVARVSDARLLYALSLESRSVALSRITLQFDKTEIRDCTPR
ncbi:MAG: hypothetical protein DWH78_15130 [Planctomycetota bacterium]|jgi:hypothetical protein|nr:MAG: hypothetical protein DWH78_15130 [Planctomycetota bacterium]